MLISPIQGDVNKAAVSFTWCQSVP